MFMKVPGPFLWLRRLPVVGTVLHRMSHAVLDPEARIWVRVSKGPARGLWIKVNPRTGRDLCEGTRESLVQESLARYLRTDMVLYDLGASFGLFTLIGARAVGMGGRVFAFEPDPEVCRRLRENVARNGMSQVQIVESAVWSKTGSTSFVRTDPRLSPDMGLGRIGAAASGSDVISVRCVALDDFVREAPPPGMIKCDVEGAEVDVVEGARALLERQKPIIVCETHSADGAERVSNMLAQTGYTVRPLDRSHLLAVPVEVGSL